MKTRLLSVLTFLALFSCVQATAFAGVAPNQSANPANVNGADVTPASPGSPTGSGTGWKANYGVTFAWFNYFTGCVTIQNTSKTPIHGWTLRWAYSGNQTILTACDGNSTQSGKLVNVANADCNKTIPAGGSVTFTFLAHYSGTNVDPTVFALQ